MGARSGLTQAFVILKQLYGNALYHESSPLRRDECCGHPHLLKRLTALTKGSMSTGFFRTVRAPSSETGGTAESTTTGISAMSASLLFRRKISHPSITGIQRSSRTREM